MECLRATPGLMTLMPNVFNVEHGVLTVVIGRPKQSVG